MAEYQIEIDSDDPFFDLSVELSGKLYIIEISWNVENEFWTISLFTSDKEPIFLGRKIVINYNLFSYCSHPLLPPGRLFALDTSFTNTECGESDLGNRVILVYTDDI